MPEEINRILCDHVSDALFCPTQNAANLLKREGITKGVHVVGDVMADVFKRSLARAEEKSTILARLKLQPKSYVLVTVHRAGNTDNSENLIALIGSLGKLEQPVIFPMHPRTRGVVRDEKLNIPQNVRVIDPVGYFDILNLETNADAIMTDSGGMQKEAYWAGVRCLTLREETEWVETIEAGWNRVVGINPDLILDTLLNWFPNGERPNIYGDGCAAEKIVEILKG
jgi:UDP-N-acetylglucosamine 2-epimerase